MTGKEFRPGLVVGAGSSAKVAPFLGMLVWGGGSLDELERNVRTKPPCTLERIDCDVFTLNGVGHKLFYPAVKFVQEGTNGIQSEKGWVTVSGACARGIFNWWVRAEAFPLESPVGVGT